MPPQNTSGEFVLEYGGSFPDLDTIRKAVDLVWSEALIVDPKVWSGLGMSPTDLPEVAPFQLKMTQGADPASITLLVIAGSAGMSISKKVLLDVWTAILLPKLKRRFGVAFRERARKR